MRLSDLKKTKNHQRVRVSATVEWEQNRLEPREIYIETPEKYASDIIPNPDAFLIGTLLPAMHRGEKRLFIDAPVSPLLKEGLASVMGFFHHWYGEPYRPLEIEAGTKENEIPAQARAGMFLSGGIDSLAALRQNRLHYPLSHPGAVKDCLMVHGFDIGGVVARGAKYDVFERGLAAMAPVAKDAQVELIPVYTNIRHLCDERELWLEKFFGAVLAAVTHVFTPRLNLVYIAASYDIPNLAPCGSHPLIDPGYSSVAMRIIHRDVEVPRIEKLRLISDWDAALQNMRVCLANVKTDLNCGKCEKCVRTMAGLLAIGTLAKTDAFPEKDLTPDHFSGFKITIRHREPFYKELLPLLEKQGRFDLADTIRSKLSE